MNISKRSIKAVLNSLDTTKNTLNIMLTLEQKKEAREDIKEQLKDVETAIIEIERERGLFKWQKRSKKC